MRVFLKIKVKTEMRGSLEVKWEYGEMRDDRL